MKDVASDPSCHGCDIDPGSTSRRTSNFLPDEVLSHRYLSTAVSKGLIGAGAFNSILHEWNLVQYLTSARAWLRIRCEVATWTFLSFGSAVFY